MTYWKGGETYHIIQAMKATGNQAGVIAQWKDAVALWAQMNRTDPDAAAVNAWLPLWQPRQLYTVEELAPLWPALGIATGFTNRWPSVVKSAQRLDHELDFHGAPGRIIDERKYFAVERLHFWREATDDEWRQEIKNAQR